MVLGPLWNSRNKALNDTAFACLQLEPRDRILEIGFGGGYLINRMIKSVPNGKVVGIDISRDIVHAAEKRFRRHIQNGKIDLECAQAETLPFPAKFFTKVCSINSIFYWQSAADAFSEISRVLERDGLLVLCFTGYKDMENRPAVREVVNLYDKEQVMELLHKAGFQELNDQTGTDRHREFYCISGRKK